MELRPSSSRSLFAPLNFAAYITWLAVLYGALAAPSKVDPWLLPTAAWTWLFALLFLGGFLGNHVLGERPRPLPSILMFAVQAGAALGLTLVSHNGASPALLVILIAQLATRASPRVTFIVALALNAVLFLELNFVWRMSAPMVVALLYAGFQAFAALVSLYAHRAEAASAELAQVNAHLLATRSLLAESARDAERLKLARELHDVAGHKLTALKLNLALVRRDPRLSGSEEVALCAQLADELLDDIRGVVRQMRAHDGLQLGEALQALAVPLTGLSVNFAVAPEAQVDSIGQAEAIVRAVQEALTNAARHAQASQVWVTLTRQGERILMDIRDNGRGASQPRFGSGLTGMRERIEALGGELDVRMPLDGGFALHAWLPLREAA